MSRTDEASISGPSPCCEGKAASFVITHSVSKRHNIGTIARCATAFGVKEVIREQDVEVAMLPVSRYVTAHKTHALMRD